jgi:hypothetical protein
VTLTTTAAPRPRFGRIRDAAKYSGRSRGRLYELAAKYPGLFVKEGASTLVSFDKLDAILDSLPAANIQPPARLRPKSQPQAQSPARRRRGLGVCHDK